MIIALEGIDASGKTTTGKMLAEHGFFYYKTPPESMADRRAEIDRSATDEEHYSFYRKTLRLASEEIAMLPGDVVVDRYWLTTYVYHRVMGLQVCLEHFEGIIMPDLTVYLEVGLEVQAERFAVRGMTDGDVRMLARMRELQMAYEEELARIQNVLRIDTSIHAPSEVVDAILQRARGALVA